MHLDFWNNPLVVSAFRVRYRRGSPGLLAATYLIVLISAGALLYEFRDELPIAWDRFFFIGLIGLQTFLSAVIAIRSTAASMANEVNNRTLDYQRIAALSPRAILLGKLIGEPALSYLLALATIPLALFSCQSSGVTMPVLLLLYGNVLTTGLLFAAIGLIHPLVPVAERKAGGRGSVGSGGWVFLIAFWLLMLTASSGGGLWSNPWFQGIVGSVVPVQSLYGVFQGDAWGQTVSLWNRDIPALLLTPVTQLLVAGVAFETMVRRLRNPLDGPMPKSAAYLLLAAADLVFVGIIQPAGLLLTYHVAEYFLSHLLMAIALAVIVTPQRVTWISWAWRFRRTASMPWNLLVGERSANLGVLVVVSLIGWLGCLLFLVVPAWFADQLRITATNAGTVAQIGCITALLTLSIGTLYQWLAIAIGRGAPMTLVLVLLVAMVLPLLLAAYSTGFAGDLARNDQQRITDYWLATTPLAHYYVWISESRAPLPTTPLVVIYALLLIGSVTLCWGTQRYHIRDVEKKLRRMGVGDRDAATR